jgi:predicted TIM-barrel fold metal-dependent hydrolase
LKLVLTEQGSGWAARAIRFMDWQWEHGPFKEQELIPMKPSEYWERQCFLGSSVLTIAEVEDRASIGVGQMMFGTDFPHAEGTWGRTTRYLQTVFHDRGVTEREVRAILGENALRCYQLDRSVLEPIAERVGPSFEDVSSAPEGPETDPFTRTWSIKPSFEM